FPTEACEPGCAPRAAEPRPKRGEGQRRSAQVASNPAPGAPYICCDAARLAAAAAARAAGSRLALAAPREKWLPVQLLPEWRRLETERSHERDLTPGRSRSRSGWLPVPVAQSDRALVS